MNINANEPTNQNLEALAKQLYDYWFVQFDFPNAEGKPYKSSGGKMVYNAQLKRDIPEGWEVKPLAELLDLFDYKRIPVSAYERENRKGIYPYYGATGIMDYINDYIFDGDYILLAEDGSTSDGHGHPIVQYIWGKTWVNNHAHIILPKERNHFMFYFFALQMIPVKNIETGSIQKKVSQENLLKYRILSPQCDLVSEFSAKVQTLYNQWKNNIEQINALIQQRDELLPLLMNGQVDITLPNSQVNSDLSAD